MENRGKENWSSLPTKATKQRKDLLVHQNQKNNNVMML